MFKIFSAGRFPQGNFTDAKSLIEGIKEIPAIIYHTSKHIANGLLEKDIPVLGKFKNLITKDNEIYADFETNENGKLYERLNKIKHISVEINKNTRKIEKVGLLPPGITPQIEGLSEFSNDGDYYIETYEIKGGKMPKETQVEEIKIEDPKEEITEEIKEIKMDQKIIKEWLKDAKIEEKMDIINIIKDSIPAEETEEEKPKTEEEIRAEIEAEYEKKMKNQKEMTEFSEIVKKKIVPAHQETYLKLFKLVQTDNIEFSEGISGTSEMMEKVKAMKDSSLLSEFATNGTKEKTAADEIKEIAERTREKYKK